MAAKASTKPTPQQENLRDEDVVVKKDASRPFYQRQQYQVGIYIDVYDAKPENPKAFGSEHFYFMSLTDLLFEQFCAADLVKIKGALEKKGLFKNAILEEFKKGIVLSVGFNDMEALEALWKLHLHGKLTAAVQDCLITNSLLKIAKSVKIHIRGKLWEDEYEACMSELASRPTKRISLDKFERDLALLRRVRDFQLKLNKDTMSARDDENKLELGLGEFVVVVKKFIPEQVKALNTMKEFKTFVKVAKGARMQGLAPVDALLKTLDKMKIIFDEVERMVCHPLSLVHAICETDHQTELKARILKTCKEGQRMLRQDTNLQKVWFPEWTPKLLPKEQPLLMGVVSLVPIGLEKMIDMDHFVDEYVTGFPQEIKAHAS